MHPCPQLCFYSSELAAQTAKGRPQLPDAVRTKPCWKKEQEDKAANGQHCGAEGH